MISKEIFPSGLFPALEATRTRHADGLRHNIGGECEIIIAADSRTQVPGDDVSKDGPANSSQQSSTRGKASFSNICWVGHKNGARKSGNREHLAQGGRERVCALIWRVGGCFGFSS